MARNNGIFSSFLNNTELLGSICLSLLKKLFGLLYGITLRPVLFLFWYIFSLPIRFGKYLSESAAKQLDGEKYFTGRLFNSLKNLVSTLIRSPRTFPALLCGYIKKGLNQYKKFFRFVLSLLLPLSSLTAMIVVIGTLADANIALRINVGDEILGYVSDEKQYIEARDKAKQKLNPSDDKTENAADMLPDVTYSLALIKINEFTDTDILCSRLIEQSKTNVVNACGIYIDGEFLCAVKNEADARRVFDAVLEQYSSVNANDNTNGNGNGNAIASFVQDIDYAEGLYPNNDDVIWDAAKLANTINSVREANVYHTVEDGETISHIADKYGMSIDELTRLNPDHKYSYSLSAGEKLLISDAKSFLTVKVTKTEVSTETIPYETVEMQSDALYQGSSRTVLSGSNGTDQVTSLVTYIEGKKVSSKEVSRITVKEPVDKRVQVGTRAPDESYTITPSQGGMFIWPAVNATNINSPYGYRWGRLHAGIDIGSSVGTSLGKLVVAAAEGTVVIAGTHSSYGYYVKIDHGNGLQTLYAHCLAGSLMVSAGEKVYAGQPIARVGMTGNATGPHLHFEVQSNGNRIDPSPYLGLK